MTPRRVAIALGACALLAGCGSGGSDSARPDDATASKSSPRDPFAQTEKDRRAKDPGSSAREQDRRRSGRPDDRGDATSPRQSRSRPAGGAVSGEPRPADARPAPGQAAAEPASPGSEPAESDTADELHLAGAAVRIYLRLLADHDPAVCTEAMTLHLVETITGRTGDAAVAKCRRDVRGAVATPVFVRFGAGRVVPGKAYVEYVARVGAVERTEVARLLKVGDRYLLDGDGREEAKKLG